MAALTLEQKMAAISGYMLANQQAPLKVMFTQPGWENAKGLEAQLPLKNAELSAEMLEMIVANIIVLPSDDQEKVDTYIECLKAELARPTPAVAIPVTSQEATPVTAPAVATTGVATTPTAPAAEDAALAFLVAAMTAAKPAPVYHAPAKSWDDDLASTVATTAAVVVTACVVGAIADYAIGAFTGRGSTTSTAFSQMMDGGW